MSELPVTHRRGLIYVAIAAIAWGTGGVVAAALYQNAGLSPVAVSWWRFVGGAAALAAGRLLRRGRQVATPAGAGGRSWLLLGVTGVGLAVYQTAYFAAIERTGVAVATVVTLGSGPLLIAIGSRVFLAEPLGLGGGAAMAVAVSGLMLLLLGDIRGSSRDLTGIGCALLSAVGYAVVTLLQRAKGSQDEVNRSVMVGFAVGGVCLLPWAVHDGLTPHGNALEAGALLGYLGVVPTALAYALFFAALRSVQATTASLVALLEPATAAVVAVTLLGERLTMTAATGAAVMLGAVVLHVRSTNAMRTS